MRNKAFSLIELAIVILIIGILIAAITQSSRLYRKMRLNTARSISQSSDVTSIPDLVFWLDATRDGVLTNSSGSTSVENNDLIQTWQSYNPQNPLLSVSFTQATSANRPAYIEDGINNLPTLYFDANTAATTGKALSINYLPELNSAKITIFVVAKAMESTSDWGSIVMNRNNASITGFNIYKNNTGSNFSFWTGNGGWTTSTTTFSFNSSYILCGSHDGSTLSFYQNGVAGAGSPATTTYIPQLIDNFWIGSSNTASWFFDGQISEIILYGRSLKTEERKSVEKYLGKKYGIVVS